MSKLKLFIIFLVLVSFIACKDKPKQKNDVINISVSIPPYADFVKQIVGNRAIVNTLIHPGTNAHSFEPTPKQLKKVLDANIYFRVGEDFKLENILIDKLESSIEKIIDCSSGIIILDRNPHYWLSPDNVKIITKTIGDTLSFLYPQHKNYFSNNRIKYLAKVDSVNQIIINVLKNKTEKSLFVYHPAWRYFGEYYGLEEIAIEQNGKHPKANDLKNFLEITKSKGASCIFFDPHFDDSSVSAVASSLELKIDSINPLPVNYVQNLFDISKKLDEYLK